jgi:DNA-binding response OmpR family regulator
VIKRILIVDDEELIRYALTAALRRDDALVLAISCGQDALAAIDHTAYDLCILDIHLPDMNGLDIMKTVKKVSPATKIIIMTASEIDAEMMKSIEEHADMLLPKPFDLDRVKSFVEHTLWAGTPVCRARDHFLNEKEKDDKPFINWLMDGTRRFELC